MAVAVVAVGRRTQHCGGNPPDDAGLLLHVLPVIGDGISDEKAAGLWVLKQNAAVAAVEGEVAAAEHPW
jgi:hypothetical protein